MVVLILAISGIIIGAAAITLGEFKATTTDVNALLAIGNATEGINTVAEQQPTLAIIAVMVIIISLIAGVFVYFTQFR